VSNSPDKNDIKLQSKINVDVEKFPVDRYAALEILGDGAAGTVYLCYDNLLKKQVTIKTLKSLSRDQVIAFQKEARATSILEHDNIIKVLDFGITSGGTPYMVMEHFGATSLDRLIKKDDHLDTATAIDIFVLVCDALSHAHKKKIFHRDVKCSNILISSETQNLQVKIIDFGVSSFKPDEFSTIVQGVTLVGTPQYMSPDQAQSRPYDARSEIYSVGCSLFEALTGVPPFRGEAALDLINKHATEQPPQLGDVAKERSFSPELEDIVQKCLEKKPENRFQTMDELKDALLRVVSFQENSIHGENPLQVGQKSDEAGGSKTRVSPVAAIVIPLAVLAVGSIGAIGWSMFGQLATPDSNLPNVARTMHVGEQIPALVPLHGIDVPTFRIETVADRRWLRADGNVLDKDMLRIKDRRDFQVLDLDRKGLTGTGLIYLRDCKLQGISLHGTTLTDKGYAALSELSTIRELILSRSDISDFNLEQLTSLSDLRFITLNDTPVTDRGMESLSKIKTLMTICIAGAQDVTGKGLRSLTRLPALSTLIVNFTGITGADLNLLKRNKTLSTLGVQQLKLTDNDIDVLSTLTGLTHLDIARNYITDKSIDTLARMKNLRELQVAECRLTQDGIERLKKRMPKCVVLTSLGIQNRRN
jgi:serine/threonine protein kinase